MVPGDGHESPRRPQRPGGRVESFGVPEGARERLPGRVPAFDGGPGPILVRVPVPTETLLQVAGFAAPPDVPILVRVLRVPIPTEKLAPGDPDPGLQQHVRSVPAPGLRLPERDERLPPVSGREVDLPEPQVRLRRRLDLLGEGTVEALRGVELAGAQGRPGDGETPVQDVLPVRRIAEKRRGGAAREPGQDGQDGRRLPDPPVFAFPGFASLDHAPGLPVRPAASANPRIRLDPTPGP